MSSKLSLKEELDLIKKRESDKVLDMEIIPKGLKSILSIEPKDRTDKMNEYVNYLNEGFEHIVDLISLAHYLGENEVSFTIGFNTLMGIPLDKTFVKEKSFIFDLIDKLKTYGINVCFEVGYDLERMSDFDGDEDLILFYNELMHYLIKIDNIDELEDIISFERGEEVLNKYKYSGNKIYNNLKDKILDKFSENKDNVRLSYLDSDYFKCHSFGFEKMYEYNVLSLLIALNKIIKEKVEIDLIIKKKPYIMKTCPHYLNNYSDNLIGQIKKRIISFKQVERKEYQYFFKIKSN